MRIELDGSLSLAMINPVKAAKHPNEYKLETNATKTFQKCKFRDLFMDFIALIG